MKYNILSALLGLGIAATAVAAPVSPEAALDRARSAAPMKARGMAAPMKLVHTGMNAGKATVYLFAGDDNFMIAPADDAAPAVLGYGDASLTDANGEMAPGFRYWMEFLGSRMAMLEANGGISYQRTAANDFAPIPSMCSTIWNQTTPFNDECPRYSGMRSVTGCVATAMSQVMKYHNWPPTGEGFNSYTYEYDGLDRTIETDFSTYTFDWDNMLDSYNDSYTSTEAAAVAHLMRAAGGAVNMGYTPYSSGAASQKVASALGNYFRYDKSVRFEPRDCYHLDVWEEMVYNSLSTYGPVVYDGSTGEAGHSFVCDGYSGEGYFHINWGWGGTSDGNFLLDFLDPYEQGTGGAGTGMNFAYSQDAILDIRPDRTGSSVWPEGQGFLLAGDGIEVETPGEYAPGEYYVIDKSMFNQSIYTIPENTLLLERYSPIPSGEPYDEYRYYMPALDPGWGFSSLGDLDVTGNVPDGRYKIRLMLQDENLVKEAYDVKVNVTKPQFYYCEVENGTQTFVKVVNVEPRVESITLPATVALDGYIVNVPMTLVRKFDGTFNANIRLELFDGNVLKGYGDAQNISVAYGTPAELQYSSVIMSVPDQQLTPGYYTGCISYQIQNDGPYVPLGEVRQIQVLSKSGLIDDILNVEGNMQEQFYDLQGRRVNGEPTDRGVYVRKIGNNVTKIMK